MYYAYIRALVYRGSESLHREQRAAIARFTEQNNLTINRGFEEKITFDRQTLPVLHEMIGRMMVPAEQTIIICGYEATPNVCKKSADLAIFVARGCDIQCVDKESILHGHIAVHYDETMRDIKEFRAIYEEWRPGKSGGRCG